MFLTGLGRDRDVGTFPPIAVFTKGESEGRKLNTLSFLGRHRSPHLLVNDLMGFASFSFSLRVFLFRPSSRLLFVF